MFTRMLCVFLSEGSFVGGESATLVVPFSSAASPVRLPEGLLHLAMRLKSEVPFAGMTLASFLVVFDGLECLFASVVKAVAIGVVHFTLFIGGNFRIRSVGIECFVR